MWSILVSQLHKQVVESNWEQVKPETYWQIQPCMSASFVLCERSLLREYEFPPSLVFLLSNLSSLSLRGDKETWIRSKYVEKKFIQKLPETGRNPLLRRSSGRRNRAVTQDRTAQRPPLKPKPNRATLPRGTGKHRETGVRTYGWKPVWLLKVY